MKRLLLLLCFTACQVDTTDNYYRHEYPEAGPAYDIYGTWCGHGLTLQFTPSTFQCDDKSTSVTYDQRYFQLKHETCGFGPVVGYRLEWGTLQLLRDGQWVAFQ